MPAKKIEDALNDSVGYICTQHARPLHIGVLLSQGLRLTPSTFKGPHRYWVMSDDFPLLYKLRQQFGQLPANVLLIEISNGAVPLPPRALDVFAVLTTRPLGSTTPLYGFRDCVCDGGYMLWLHPEKLSGRQRIVRALKKERFWLDRPEMCELLMDMGFGEISQKTVLPFRRSGRFVLNGGKIVQRF